MAAPGTPWFKLYTQLPDHPKTRKLAKEIKRSVPATIGHLVCLWSWVTEYRPDGDLSGLSPDEVEAGSRWSGTQGRFDRGLIASGFVELSDSNRRVHDWMDYAGSYSRAKTQEKYRRGKQESKESDTTVISQLPDSYPERRGEERRGEEIKTIVPNSATSGPSSPEFLRIPLSGKGGEHIVTDADITEYERSFPALEIRQHLRNIRQWNIDNPKNRKTKNGIRKHIGFWLSKEQNKARVAPTETQATLARTVKRGIEDKKRVALDEGGSFQDNEKNIERIREISKSIGKRME